MNLKRKRIGKGYLRYKSADDAPAWLGMSRQKVTDLGHTTDRGLMERWAVRRRFGNPLRRFLRRQVGRTWAEVRSELDAKLRRLNAPSEVVRDLRRELVDWIEAELPQLLNFRQVEFRVDTATGRLELRTLR